MLKRFGGSAAHDRALLEAGLVIERSGRASPATTTASATASCSRSATRAGGRSPSAAASSTAAEPKYLNSPETPLFHKGRELYGLYEARQALRKVERLLVVEGYMDVVRLAQSGIPYAVATLGTATTPEHLNRLFRATSEVVFCFDGDRAGRTAAWRALENALEHARDGRQLRFLFLPEGHDPDTLVGAEGAEAFEARIAGRPADLGVPGQRSSSHARTSRASTAAPGSPSSPGPCSRGCRRRLSGAPARAPGRGGAHARGPARRAASGGPAARRAGRGASPVRRAASGPRAPPAASRS